MASIVELERYLKNSRRIKFKNNHDHYVAIFKTNTYIMDVLTKYQNQRYNINVFTKDVNKPEFIGCMSVRETLAYFQTITKK